jgi:hypothetical protein
MYRVAVSPHVYGSPKEMQGVPVRPAQKAKQLRAEMVVLAGKSAYNKLKTITKRRLTYETDGS